jgi:AcrR family transcriptional regulator
MRRAEQRDETRSRIIEAAIEAFAEHGYRASSTRDIAARAGVTQGLVTYHFESKDALWRAAADRIFGQLVDEVPDRPKAASRAARREEVREAIRSYVRFAASQPALFHFMVDAGKHSDERMSWLVETHLAHRFAGIARFAGVAFPGSGPKLAPHVYYALAGAASLIFAVAPECGVLAGVDPMSRAAIERHADLIARLFVPE